MLTDTATTIPEFGLLDPPFDLVPMPLRTRLARLAAEAGEDTAQLVFAYTQETSERAAPAEDDQAGTSRFILSVARVSAIGASVTVSVFLDEYGVEVDSCRVYVGRGAVLRGVER